MTWKIRNKMADKSTTMEPIEATEKRTKNTQKKTQHGQKLKENNRFILIYNKRKNLMYLSYFVKNTIILSSL